MISGMLIMVAKSIHVLVPSSTITNATCVGLELTLGLGFYRKKLRGRKGGEG
jgi:hypothetical protein